MILFGFIRHFKGFQISRRFTKQIFRFMSLIYFFLKESITKYFPYLYYYAERVKCKGHIYMRNKIITLH